MQKQQTIRIGTRGSKLALVQANLVQNLLLAAHPDLRTEIVPITTTGDRILEKNLSEIGGKGLFTKEIEEALLAGSIDIAVHSMKDMPAFFGDDFTIACILKREDPRDALISKVATKISDLPQGAIIGTSSPRRAAQVLNLRPDVKIVPFRGNIDTRLGKMHQNHVDATFLAIAGIKRCKINDEIISIIDEKEMLPAVAQGAIGIEILQKNDWLRPFLQPLNDEESFICVSAERAFLAEFEGSCKTPIGALAKIEGKSITANFLHASLDGSKIVRSQKSGDIAEAESLGKAAALEILAASDW